MNDLTLLHYTSSRVSEAFGDVVRRQLRLAAPPDAPLVSVSQRPLDFGENVCIGDIGASTYNCYRQILVGAERVKTPFVACCEDDTLYTASHFAVRPDPSVFLYDWNRWWLEPDGLFYYRRRTSMALCICATALLIDTLRAKFAAYPVPVESRWWSEPGRYEHHLGLSRPRMDFFEASQPNILINHAFPSLGGQRARKGDDGVAELPPWGSGAALWARLGAD